MKSTERNISAIRTDYTLAGLSENEVFENPFAQFGKWFDEALENQVMEPNAMTLSTVSAEGQPSARIVLLKDFDDVGFSFYTNYESRKGEELKANPCAALLFFWPELQRQVRIEGVVERLDINTSEQYFQSRPVGSRLGAMASPQSRSIADRRVLEDAVKKLEVEFQVNGYIAKPDFWGGYHLKPQRFEFWQGRSSRLHDRLVFEKTATSAWQLKRLAP